MEGYISEVRLFGGNFAPRAWAFCNGASMSISVYTALYSLIGTTYGGDGQTTFNLPDLRGRSAVGTGQGPGLSPYSLGEVTGTPSITLTSNQMPLHAHSITESIKVSSAAGTLAVPTATVNTLGALADAGGSPFGAYNNDPAPAISLNMAAAASPPTGPQGGSQPYNNMQPYLALNYIICIEGIFPSRN